MPTWSIGCNVRLPLFMKKIVDGCDDEEKSTWQKSNTVSPKASLPTSCPRPCWSGRKSSPRRWWSLGRTIRSKHDNIKKRDK